MMEWQPIETAPMDGTPLILGLITHGKVWRVFDGRHNGLAWYAIDGTYIPSPTHWMPLPVPPKVEVSDG